jgi:hypothetical protein
MSSDMLMRKAEHLPTKNQLEPYKATFEVLIDEVLVSLSNES